MNRLSRDELVEKLKSIKLLALDVDGVLTDDTLLFGPDGFEAKRFNISDGPPFVEFELPAGSSFDVTVTAPGWEDPIQSSLKVGDKARQRVIFAPGP